MFPIKLLNVVLLIAVFRLADSSFRKIKDGQIIDESMRFMVYLTKAEKSDTLYDAWICGGSIVTSQFIVTSAACVEDVQFMYAIAGYDKYVNVKDIDTDECTKASKKKIVFICVPKSYDFAYDKIEKWAFIDLAAVKVESPYDFNAAAPLPGCTWVPGIIEINYDVKYQAPNTDAMILGWGHAEKWRQPGDPTDYNQESLQYSSILTMDKEECKTQYGKTPTLIPIIEKYMVCALKEGNINDKGDLIRKEKPTLNGCINNFVRVGGVCQDPNQQPENESIDQFISNVQRHSTPNETVAPKPVDPYAYMNLKPPETPQPKPKTNPNAYVESLTNARPEADDAITFDDIVLSLRRMGENDTKQYRKSNYTRKTGICQNDHGGPLVTWVGKHERLIGVASVFRLDKSYNCVGPYLFTSTYCNGAFLDCVINEVSAADPVAPTVPTVPTVRTASPVITTKAGAIVTEKITTKATTTAEPVVNNQLRRNREFCNLPPSEKGFDTVERRVSWRSHPDGPAENELDEDLFMRPQIPLH